MSLIKSSFLHHPLLLIQLRQRILQIMNFIRARIISGMKPKSYFNVVKTQTYSNFKVKQSEMVQDEYVHAFQMNVLSTILI